MRKAVSTVRLAARLFFLLVLVVPLTPIAVLPVAHAAPALAVHPDASAGPLAPRGASHFAISPPALSARVRGAMPTGLPVEPGWTADGNDAGANMGYAVAIAGDINGDGWDDVVLGAPGYMPGFLDRSGAVFVFYGSATGLSPVPDWQAQSDQFGYPLNYDQAPEFGASVAGGDWNCDGYADIAVGMPFYNLWNQEIDEGAVFVWYGGPNGLGAPGTLDNADWRAESNQSAGPTDFGDTMFGYSVANAGDVNGDGCTDLIVGAPGYDKLEPCGQDHGRVFVWYGSHAGLGENGTADNADWTADSGNISYAHMGYVVGSAGNVNGDCCDDIIVGAEALGVYVWYGSAQGLGPEGHPNNAAWKVESDGHGLGTAAGTAGDVNDDGCDDVIVGVPRHPGQSVNEGQARVYLGSANNGLGSSAAWTMTGDQPGAQFGFSVGAAGDVNGDDYSDIIVGAPYYANGQTNEGRAYVYYGSAVGPASTPGWTAESDQAGARFGYAVGGGGDIGGYTLDDILVGAPYYDHSQADEGRAYAYMDTGAPFQVWVEVQPGRVLTLTADGWYTPNPVTYRVHVWSEQALDLEGTLKLEFPVEEVDRGVFLTFVPQTNPGGGQTGPDANCWQVAEQAFCESPIAGTEHVPALEEHVISWTVWVQPMTATTIHGTVDLFPSGDPGQLVHARAPNVVVPQARVRPVVIIPGFLGTMLPGPQGVLDPILHVYDPLWQYLEDLGYKPGITLFEFPYDWRESLAVTAPLLGTKVAWIKDPQRPGPRPGYVDFSSVDVVAHSMGGLVARAYLESGDHSGDVKKLITLATPHRGSPDGYPGWEGADTEDPSLQLLLQAFAVGESSYCHHWCNVAPPYDPHPITVPCCSTEELFQYIQNKVLGLRDLLPAADVTGADAYLISASRNPSPYPYGRPDNLVLDDLNDPGGNYDVLKMNNPGLTTWALFTDHFLKTRVGFYVQRCYDVSCNGAPPTAPLWQNGQPTRVRQSDGTLIPLERTGPGDLVVPAYSADITKIPWLYNQVNVHAVNLADLGLAGDSEYQRHEFIATIPKVLEWVGETLTGVVLPQPGP